MQSCLHCCSRCLTAVSGVHDVLCLQWDVFCVGSGMFFVFAVGDDFCLIGDDFCLVEGMGKRLIVLNLVFQYNIHFYTKNL